MSDWKSKHANDAEAAVYHPLVVDVIAEQMANLGTDDRLTHYGLTKIATYAAQVARAQALGFDPELLRLSASEANEDQLRLARAAVAAGKPVWLIDDDGATRLD